MVNGAVLCRGREKGGREERGKRGGGEGAGEGGGKVL